MNMQLPGNPRVQPKDLRDDLGYDNLTRAVVMVELANIDTLAEIGVIPQEEYVLLTNDMREKVLAIPTTKVDEVERAVTKHDIRALVQIMQEMLPKPLRRYVHLLLTSFDARDTATSLQFLMVHGNVIRPLSSKVIVLFIEKIRALAHMVQIGRTHGRYALPITAGFWLASILHRIVYNRAQADDFSDHLVGKISGAVGAYNAQHGLGITARCGDKTYEERVLEKLGLRPAPISTQILPPEPLADYLWAILKLTAALGQFGRDCRHLMRDGIEEVSEPFEQGQVGSSTMAHKRNPINFENIEGTWLRSKNEFGKVLDTFISDHQRDLVGSTVSRDFPILVVNVTSQLNKLLQGKEGQPTFLERITVDPEACARNLKHAGSAILAEPIYIALQLFGGYEGDAHKLVNEKALAWSKRNRVDLFTATFECLARELGDGQEGSFAAQRVIDRIPKDVRDLLLSPEKYTGLAAEKALQIVDHAEMFVRFD
jgi:adenylosuccinate lyase